MSHRLSHLSHLNHLIVDDILIQFDDRRAAAALAVLSHLAKLTQVIFFTHHQHLVELAKANLDRSTLFIHSLIKG